LTRPVQDLDLLVVGGQLVGDGAGTVRAVVVGDQHVDGRRGATHPVDDDPDVVGLVVRRDHHQDPADPRVALVPARRRGALGHRTSSCRGARRRRRYHPATTSAVTAPAASATSGPAPSLVASVRARPSRTSRTAAACVFIRVASRTLPSGSTKPDTPTVEAISPGRPCSTAGSRTIASCWVASARLNVALLVWVTSNCAPPVTVSRTRLS